MGQVVNFREEIERLEDQKWDILLARGQHAAAELWKPIDARLEMLYRWWANHAYSSGTESELPFHLRRHT